MSLKFNEALKILSEGVPKPSKPEHKLYIQDAVEISEKINEELIKMNSIFKGTVSNWEDTCTFLLKDIYKIWLPYLRINMPFKIEPKLIKFQPLRMYKLKTSVYHPAVENGFVNGVKLTELFYWDVSQVIERLGKVNCKSGKIYSSLYTKFTYCSHKKYLNIAVKEQEAQEAPSILYQFNLCFTFSQESPTYVFLDDYFHLTDNLLRDEVAKVSKLVNKINMLLLHLHLDPSLTVEKMHNIIAYTIVRSKRDKVEEILLEAMTRFIPFLKNPGPLMCARGKLWQYKQANSVNVSELKAVFGMQ